MRRPRGWTKHPREHALAARGIPSRRRTVVARGELVDEPTLWFDEDVGGEKKEEIERIMDSFERRFLTKKELETFDKFYFHSEEREAGGEYHHSDDSIHIYGVGVYEINKLTQLVGHEVAHRTWLRWWEEKKEDERLMSLIMDFVMASIDEGALTKYSDRFYDDGSDPRKLLGYISENYAEANRKYMFFREDIVKGRLERGKPRTYDAWLSLKRYDDIGGDEE